MGNRGQALRSAEPAEMVAPGVRAGAASWCGADAVVQTQPRTVAGVYPHKGWPVQRGHADRCGVRHPREVGVVAVTISKDDATLDDLLSRWHVWQWSNVGRGFNRKALVAGDYRCSRQYDDQNGALDARIDHIQMQAVEFAVGQMVDPYRAAIYMQARALHLGVAVFTSPRLPSDPQDRAAIVSVARQLLTTRLQSAGVM